MTVPAELERVAGVLKAQGFALYQGKVLLNPDATALKSAFDDFIQRYGFQAENRLLFFFSGHGHTWAAGGHGYLVPADAPLPASEQDNPGEAFLKKALHMSQVLAWTRQMTAKHALFLFDSCFSGTIFTQKAQPKRPRSIDRATALPVRQFVTAGDAGETVPSKSVFAPAFADALEFRWGDLDKDGYVTATELGLHLRAKVSENASQTPQFGWHPDYDLSRGDFVFEVGKAITQAAAATPVAPVPPPPPLRGFLQVNVNVAGAQVRVNGQAVGEASPASPLNLTGLPAGPAVVEVTAPGYAPARREVVVPPNTWGQVYVALESEAAVGYLTVRSNVAGDTWYLDGKPIGPTSPTAHEVAPGAHSVRVEKPGHAPYEEQVTLAAGERLTVRAELTLAAEPGVEAAAGTGVPEPEMVLVRGGSFRMGSPESEDGRDTDEKQHPVKVGDFYLGKREVTVGAFRRFVEASGYRTEAERTGEGCAVWTGSEWEYQRDRSWRAPGFDQGEDHPVACVSWNDALTYTDWLSNQSGRRYRLPTEAEWEYAARAGTTTARFWGDDPGEACRYANVADRAAKRKYSNWAIHECDDRAVHTAPVASYVPNPWGLYDMLGNVLEWTCSAYNADYDGSETRCAAASAGGLRSLRGGAWNNKPTRVRAANRNRNEPGNRNNNLGFRLANTPAVWPGKLSGTAQSRMAHGPSGRGARVSMSSPPGLARTGGRIVLSRTAGHGVGRVTEGPVPILVETNRSGLAPCSLGQGVVAAAYGR